MTVGADVLAALVRRVQDGAPHLPEPGAPPAWRRTRLVCVDGPAGSGKTTLAGQLAAELCCQVVHMDDLYEGWADGPDGGAARLRRRVLAPLAAGRAGEYRRFDWYAATWAETHAVEPAPFLVVEGCGAGARGVAEWVTLLVWVEADDAERLRRGIARDGEDVREEWLRWMEVESAHYAAEQTRARAHVRIDGFGRPHAPGTERGEQR